MHVGPTYDHIRSYIVSETHAHTHTHTHTHALLTLHNSSVQLAKHTEEVNELLKVQDTLMKTLEEHLAVKKK